MSDWEARPLSERQMTYAALDAHVLLRLYDEFTVRLPDAAASARRAAVLFKVTALALHALRVFAHQRKVPT